MESKKYNKLVNITKRSRLKDIQDKLMVTSEERESRRGNIGVGEWEVQTTGYKIGYKDVLTVQHGKYSQYFEGPYLPPFPVQNDPLRGRDTP